MVCQQCGDEVDELLSARVKGKKRKVCQECLELIQEKEEIAEEAESAMKDMMEYKG